MTMADLIFRGGAVNFGLWMLLAIAAFGAIGLCLFRGKQSLGLCAGSLELQLRLGLALVLCALFQAFCVPNYSFWSQELLMASALVVMLRIGLTGIPLLAAQTLLMRWRCGKLPPMPALNVAGGLTAILDVGAIVAGVVAVVWLRTS